MFFSRMQLFLCLLPIPIVHNQNVQFQLRNISSRTPYHVKQKHKSMNTNTLMLHNRRNGRELNHNNKVHDRGWWSAKRLLSSHCYMDPGSYLRLINRFDWTAGATARDLVATNSKHAVGRGRKLQPYGWKLWHDWPQTTTSLPRTLTLGPRLMILASLLFLHSPYSLLMNRLATRSIVWKLPGGGQGGLKITRHVKHDLQWYYTSRRFWTKIAPWKPEFYVPSYTRRHSNGTLPFP